VERRVEMSHDLEQRQSFSQRIAAGVDWLVTTAHIQWLEVMISLSLLSWSVLIFPSVELTIPNHAVLEFYADPHVWGGLCLSLFGLQVLAAVFNRPVARIWVLFAIFTWWLFVTVAVLVYAPLSTAFGVYSANALASAICIFRRIDAWKRHGD
jgi:hypothetical protein